MLKKSTDSWTMLKGVRTSAELQNWRRYKYMRETVELAKERLYGTISVNVYARSWHEVDVSCSKMHKRKYYAPQFSVCSSTFDIQPLHMWNAPALALQLSSTRWSIGERNETPVYWRPKWDYGDSFDFEIIFSFV